MELIGLLVDDKPGVMQRISGVFTRKKCNIETIVVGKCEVPHQSRIVLSIKERGDAQTVIRILEKLEDVHDVKILNGDAHYECLAMDDTGRTERVAGSKQEIDAFMNKNEWKKFIKVIYALW